MTPTIWGLKKLHGTLPVRFFAHESNCKDQRFGNSIRLVSHQFFKTEDGDLPNQLVGGFNHLEK